MSLLAIFLKLGIENAFVLWFSKARGNAYFIVIEKWLLWALGNVEDDRVCTSQWQLSLKPAPASENKLDSFYYICYEM